MGLEEPAWSWVRGDLDWISGKGFSHRVCLSPETDSPEKAPSLREFRECLDNMLRHMVWFLGCPLQDHQELELGNPDGSFPTIFCDSMKIYNQLGEYYTIFSLILTHTPSIPILLLVLILKFCSFLEHLGTENVAFKVRYRDIFSDLNTFLSTS